MTKQNKADCSQFLLHEQLTRVIYMEATRTHYTHTHPSTHTQPPRHTQKYTITPETQTHTGPPPNASIQTPHTHIHTLSLWLLYDCVSLSPAGLVPAPVSGRWGLHGRVCVNALMLSQRGASASASAPHLASPPAVPASLCYHGYAGGEKFSISNGTLLLIVLCSSFYT